MQKNENTSQVGLFILDFSDGRTCPVQPTLGRRPEKISELYSKKLSQLRACPAIRRVQIAPLDFPSVEADFPQAS